MGLKYLVYLYTFSELIVARIPIHPPLPLVTGNYRGRALLWHEYNGITGVIFGVDCVQSALPENQFFYGATGIGLP